MSDDLRTMCRDDLEELVLDGLEKHMTGLADQYREQIGKLRGLERRKYRRARRI